MNENIARKIVNPGRSVEEEIQRIDLLNLQNDGKYRYSVSTFLEHQKYQGEIEAVDASDAKNYVQELMKEKGLDLGEAHITIYEWIPETLEEEGMWDDVEQSLEKIVQETMDLKRIEGKTIKTARTMTDGNELKLRLIFTDGIEFIIGIDDFNKGKSLDWFISPF